MNLIKSLILKYKQIIIYGMCSVFVTIIDVLIVWLLKNKSGMDIVTANTIGKTTGSIVQYFIIIGIIFGKKADFKNALIFCITFLIGLFIANITIYISYNSLIDSFEDNIVFAISKFLSLVLPFFVVYGLRKYLYKKF